MGIGLNGDNNGKGPWSLNIYIIFSNYSKILDIHKNWISMLRLFEKVGLDFANSKAQNFLKNSLRLDFDHSELKQLLERPVWSLS